MKIKQICLSFLYPRFSTHEMESSVLKGNEKFEITSIIYDDLQPRLPIRALGAVRTNFGRKRAVWNEYGECSIDGKRSTWHDMQRPDRDRNNSDTTATLILVGMILLLMSILKWI